MIARWRTRAALPVALAACVTSLAANDLSSEDGDVFVVRAGRTYKLLATNSMGEPIMATPAVSGNAIFIRTLTKLMAIR